MQGKILGAMVMKKARVGDNTRRNASGIRRLRQRAPARHMLLQLISQGFYHFH